MADQPTEPQPAAAASPPQQRDPAPEQSEPTPKQSEPISKPSEPIAQQAQQPENGTDVEQGQIAAEPMPAQDDLESDAGDSSYDDTESYTTSIKSSVTNYKFEHGRRYHAYQEGKYVVPNDEQEQDRLDLQYHALRLSYDNKSFFAPIGDAPQAILDIGTGTGIWAIDVADEYPSAVVTGTDLSPIQPRWVPPNVKFEVDDVEQEWTYNDDHFDLIHTRIMNGSIRNWPVLFQRIKCKPGGWVECQELDVDARTDDGSLPKDSYIKKWCENQQAAAKIAGVTLRISGDILKEQMMQAGFTNIVIRNFRLPIGPWAAEEQKREIGAAQLVAMLEGIQGLTLALWTRFLGWSDQEVEVCLAHVRNEFKSKKVHSYWPLYAVYGQKPMSS
ncbi:MAG: hypothetical protein M1817_005542 [Caeruleum heppii]|nr:MAG: hypothetical protein M1817_005542 [Caeruleum heppii]